MLKKLLVGGILMSSIGVTNAGIPVIDAGSLAQAVIQVQQQVTEIKEAKNRLKSMTGNAGLGQLVNDPTVRKKLNQYLPKGYTDINQVMRKGDVGALQGILNQVKQQEADYKGKGKERLAATVLLNQANMQGLLKSLDTRSNNVDRLISQINATTDVSSKADLANSLAAEQANINVEMNRMNILMKQSEFQLQLAEKQTANEYRQNRRR